jgi:hypothetical protein
LVIVDEAHRVGADGTTRFARVAALAARAPILLLTATPVVNRLGDRDRLLRLFTGEHTDFAVEDVVIRRTGAAERLPPVRRLAPLKVAAEVPELARALAELPPPFPVADGSAATALVVTALAFAWRSSLAALANALARREARGRALEDELAAGRWPDRTTLRRWILGDEPAQLTLRLGSVEPSQKLPRDALRTLQTHLAAVRAIRAIIDPLIAADTANRATALLNLLSTRSPARAVCFAHHAETIRALWSALRQTAGVVAITGARVRAAAGRWSREEVLRALGPRGTAWRPDDPRGIRLLLTTDLLAEGVELPGVEIVVHGDGAWTPARLEQRVGRARRPSNPAEQVLVTGFAAPVGSESLLQLGDRLRAKRRARREALGQVEASDLLHATLAVWRAAPAPSEDRVHLDEEFTVVAAFEHRTQAFVALLTGAHESELLAARRLGTRLRLSVDPIEVLGQLKNATRSEVAVDHAFARTARRLVDRFLARRAARATIGSTVSPRASVHRALRRRLLAIIDRTSLADRSSVSGRCQRLLLDTARVNTISIDRELRRLLKSFPRDSDLLDALENAARGWLARRQNEPRESARLVALLLFQPRN